MGSIKIPKPKWIQGQSGTVVRSPRTQLSSVACHFVLMRRWPMVLFPLLLAGSLATPGAGAIPPPPNSFDGETSRCQLAGSAATVLICRDAELTALDGQLRQAFRRLLADTSLKHPVREDLVENQRRWLNTMEQCWRARENLRPCVKASQQQRLKQLERLALQRRLPPGANDERKRCDG